MHQIAVGVDEDTENIVDVDDRHTYGRTWYDVVSTGMIGEGNIQP